MTLPPVLHPKKPLKERVCCNVNRRLLAIKAYYFLNGGGTSAVSPFVSLVAKSIGFSVSFIGVVNTITVVFALVAKPLVGGFTDKFGHHKVVWLVCYIVMTVFTFSLIFIPHLPKSVPATEIVSSTFYCGKSGTEIHVCNVTNVNNPNQTPQQSQLSQCNLKCVTPKTESQYCHRNFPECFWSLRVTDDGGVEEFLLQRSSLAMDRQNSIILTTFIDWELLRAFSNHCIAVPVLNVLIAKCHHYIELKCSLRCSGSVVKDFNVQENNPETVNYWSFQLWWFSSAVIVSGVAKRVVEVIQTALVYSILDTRYHLFGKQKLFGSLGNGIVFVVSGILNQMHNAHLEHKNYPYGFYIYAVFLSMAVVVICVFKVIVEPKANDIVKSVASVIVRPNIAFFFGAVFISGICGSFSNTFSFWFLTDLNVSPLMLGLSRGVQAFAAEIPCFYFSGWVIEKVGHEYVVSFTLFCYGVGFITSSFMKNVYLIFLTDFIHGVAFGLFQPAVTSYVSLVSPPGMKTVMQGILFAVYKGAGRIVGNLAGGLVYASLGGRLTFRIFGGVALGCAFLYSFLVVILKKRHTRTADITTSTSNTR